MPNSIRVFAGLILAALPFHVFPFMQVPDNPPGPAEGTIELPDMEVRDKKQELALRFIKAGLEADRSTKYEDRNKPYCWFDKATGSHMTYLYCSLNKDLDHASRWAQGLLGYGPGDSPAFRTKVYRSVFPVNRGEVDRMLDRLGPSKVNNELVTQALQGAPLPEADLPDDSELERFAAALARVREIRSDLERALQEADKDRRRETVARGDRLMAEAIRDAGLTVVRYNEISDLVERLDTLREQVRERLARR